jgi:V8-like Glu-specific endopeptidase
VALAAAALGVAAQPAAAAEPGSQRPAAIRDYWTPERMRDAVPPRPLVSPFQARRRGTIAKPVRGYRQKPNRSHGKVFFTLGGVDYVCSGTAVEAPGENVVWTAGHCVFGATGPLQTGYASNFEFVPAYRNGNSPFGEWPKQRQKGLDTTRQWRRSSEGCVPFTSCGDVAHDFGAANVVKRNGKTLQEVVGGRGIQFNGPRDRRYKAIGYPAEAPFDGERMYACRSDYRGADNAQGNPPPMRIRCDMTGGSSGGGWIADGEVASVVSYGYSDEPNRLYGPYQGAAARSLYDDVKSG